MNIAANHQKILQTLGPKVRLVAVTKNRSLAEIRELIEAGVTHIGENRVQEAKEKFPHLPTTVEKHLIGHLQTNKAKEAVRLFDMIQSVDSLRLARKIDAEAAKIGRVMPLLIQVNVAADPNKHGFPLDDLFCPLKAIGAELPNVQIKGLMAIVPYSENPEKTRPHFKKMHELFETISLTKFPGVEMEILSMGMSHDYRIALEEGSTMVRIGSALFE